MTQFSAQAATGLYALQADSIDGQRVSLSQYEGKVSLVVNTASRCGFTPQYKDLEALYQKYRSQGFVVLAFPSNDFADQEPGSNAEIKSFCEAKFKTSFPMFSKAKVTGDDRQEVYRFLTKQSDPTLQGDVAWNFEKFLIDKKGKVVGRYKSRTNPMDDELQKKIETLLKQS